MLGSRVSERYFGYLFKEPIQGPRLRWNVLDWPGVCFTSQGVLGAAAEALIRDEHQRPAWLLDYDARDLKGTVVSQVLWGPQSQNATKKFVLDAALQWPIFFVRSDGTVGLPLREAIEGSGRTLLWAQQPAPIGRQATFHLRIKWPGYEGWQRQLQARDDTNERNPITLAKFAQHVGRFVDCFLKRCEGHPTSDAKWEIGRDGILHREVLVLGALHASIGTWQPILALTKVVM
ncbi:hypothetical protein BJV78DRAFT_1127548 [Lactifluus subvellereus]|nr:hypothetical protein BJV78DRAFT_1127548 [Lactifluus subvellereus]